MIMTLILGVKELMDFYLIIAYFVFFFTFFAYLKVRRVERTSLYLIKEGANYGSEFNLRFGWWY